MISSLLFVPCSPLISNAADLINAPTGRTMSSRFSSGVMGSGPGFWHAIEALAVLFNPVLP
jgi:hypothetical protein